MADAEYQSAPFIFVNKGLQARYAIDRALDPNVYFNLLNSESRQENSISSRLGRHQILNNGTSNLPLADTNVHTLARLKSLGGATYRYAGAGTNLYRRAGDTDGAYTTINGATALSGNRFSTGTYRPDLSSFPYLFVADSSAMLKDNGTLTTAQRMGILQPTIPATATNLAGVLTGIQDFEVDSGFTYIGIGAHSAVSQVNTTISAIAATGVQNATPVSMTNILPGSYLNIDTAGSAEKVLVTAVTQSTFTANFTLTHAGGVACTDTGLSATVTGPAPAGGSVARNFAATSLNTPGSTTNAAPNDVFSILVQATDAAHFNQLSVAFSSANGTWQYTTTATNQAFPAMVSGQWLQVKIPRSAFTKTGSPDWSVITSFVIQGGFSTGATSLVFLVNDLVLFAGGPDVTGGVSYNYRYTYYNINTGAESNPSVAMIPGNFVFPVNQAVTVSWTASADPQVTHVRVYRQGGTLPTNWLKVGEVPIGTTSFFDTLPDAAIVTNRILEFDNDPPVTSTLRVPVDTTLGGTLYGIASIVRTNKIVTVTTSTANTFTTSQLVTISGVFGGSGTSFNGTFIITVSSSTVFTYSQLGPDATGDLSMGGTASGQVGTGTQTVSPASITNIFANQTLTIDGGTSTQETVIVQTVVGATFTAFFQYVHANSARVQAVSRPARALNLMEIAFDRAWLAGDPDNPHYLYYSKKTRPEACPPQNFVEVGNPSDPIMAVVEFRGALFVFTLANVYQLLGANTAFTPLPYITSAKHGLWANFGWTIAEGEIWFQGADGIYAFQGSTAAYVSQPIEWLFRNQPLGPVVPMDPTQIGSTVMSYYQQEVYISYVGTDTNRHRVIWSQTYKRFRNDDTPANCMIFEEDVNKLLFGRTTGMIYQDRVAGPDDQGFSGGVAQTDPFTWTVQTVALDLGTPKIFKWWNEFTVDIDTGGVNVAVALLFDNGATAVSLGNVNTNGRSQVQFNVNAGLGQRSRNVSLKLVATVSTNIVITVYECHIRAVLDAELRQSFDSFWLNYGDESWKIVKQGFFTYIANDPGGITFSLYVEGNLTTPEFTFTLPQATVRTTKRVRFPATKAKLFRWIATSAGDYQLYAGSWVETKGIVQSKGYQRQLLMA